MTDLRTAALRVLEAMEDAHNLLPGMYDKHLLGIKQRHFNAITALREALAQPEDKSQAAFEHWVETVEATQGCAISRNAVADATCKQSLQVEPCNKSCAPGYCYCEPIIKPEIKGHNVKPPPEAQTEAEKIAYCAGWWAAMEAKREQQEPVAWQVHPFDYGIGSEGVYAMTQRPNQVKAWERKGWTVQPLYTHPSRQWQGLTNEEVDQMASNAVDAWECARAVEEKLRAKNSTLACIPAVPPG